MLGQVHGFAAGLYHRLLRDRSRDRGRAPRVHHQLRDRVRPSRDAPVAFSRSRDDLDAVGNLELEHELYGALAVGRIDLHLDPVGAELPLWLGMDRRQLVGPAARLALRLAPPRWTVVFALVGQGHERTRGPWWVRGIRVSGYGRVGRR